MKTLTQNPIFVVGYPRSGTTLLQSLLATQGDLVTFPETHLFTTFFEFNGGLELEVDFELAEKIMAEVSRRSQLSCYIEQLKTGDGQNGPETVNVKDLFELYLLKNFPELEMSGRRWLEKTPDHGLWAKKIYSLYPESKFVYIIRNPFHAIYSRTKYFVPDTDDLIGVLADQWRYNIEKYEEFSSEYPDASCLVRYEDLVKNPKKWIEEICNFLNMEFVPNNLKEYSEKASSIIRPFEYWKDDVIKQQIYVRNVDPKKIFSFQEIVKIQSIVFKYMERYQYKIEFPLLQRCKNLISRIMSVREVDAI
ncbi:hypothetical protein C2E25_15140 [Geothermobacter hydrogeniphilus]|uniref:Sulfotransferase family protein n=1 Tax=Geothermobacter hydrogeniphilus TaxID=1969733 RepID=A0A2K2H6M2_9BACT|nr:sulfotransferase [Geothermobacter hydrogeniphilus]PNU18897.1 hypothetical protein C2E25_15140 [Geothermobacter hydrogeniphilus]